MKSLPETRYTLIGKLQNAQDAEAWLEFTTIYQPAIFRFCLAKGLQHADATDVTQEVLTKVVVAIESFDLGGESKNFRGWLYRVTRNLVIDFVRKRQNNPLVQFDPGLDLATLEDPADDESAEFQVAFNKQIFRYVARKIQLQVTYETWQAFWETEIKQRTVAEVSRQLGKSAGSIYVARSRMLARFKTEVEQLLNGSSEHLSGQE